MREVEKEDAPDQTRAAAVAALTEVRQRKLKTRSYDLRDEEAELALSLILDTDAFKPTVRDLETRARLSFEEALGAFW